MRLTSAQLGDPQRPRGQADYHPWRIDRRIDHGCVRRGACQRKQVISGGWGGFGKVCMEDTLVLPWGRGWIARASSEVEGAEV